MADDRGVANPLFIKPLVYQLPYSGAVREGIDYASEARGFDIYYPRNNEGLAPVAVLVTGYPIQGNKDWARLLAANGIAAVIYNNVEPVADALTVIDYLKTESAQLQIDPERVALWSCSGNVPNAINVLNEAASLRCAVLLYGFMLDAPDSKLIAQASANFHFVNPNRGMQDFPENTPILIIGAGKDEFPGLNESIDAFEAEAIARNSPVSVVRYPEGVHGFDILDDSQRSIEMIKLCVGFLRLRLNVY